MDGYQRTDAVRERLLAELRIALTAYPTQRLGQLLSNAALPPGAGRVTDDLWNVWDEDVIRALQTYGERRELPGERADSSEPCAPDGAQALGDEK